jgi:DNA-binding response OmpR family regulator
MPDVSGLDLCRMVRARSTPHYTYIILLTTLEGRGRCLEALEAGADDFLSKPLDAEHLVARIRVAERVMGLRARLTHLEDILAVCMHCKRIRGDDSLWMPVETYVEKRCERPLSHSLCPECYARELARLKVNRP